MLRSSTNTLVLTLFFLFCGFSSSQAVLTTCPTAETTLTTAAGLRYAICPGTDYEHGGRSLQIVPNISSAQACAEICILDTRCVKAVHDKAKSLCHVKDKANPMTWAASASFNSIRLAATDPLPELTFISSCPFQDTARQSLNGVKYRICPGTDYQGYSIQVLPGFASAIACADRCSTTANCKKAVYDTKGKICHIKGPEPQYSLFWVQNKVFTSIHVDAVANPGIYGKWSDLIRLPVTPVAVAIIPTFPSSQRMLFWSSWGATAFGGASGVTMFGDYNFITGAVSERSVSNTHHDMFCPGISQLQDGRIIITGGDDAKTVSIYNPATNEFTNAPDMKLARGYQSSAILSNGKVFTIGGAYSGLRQANNGEIYDPVTNTWTYLPKAEATPMLTVDVGGLWREDNHAWLFAWKDSSVFQAGPSKTQHWYNTNGQGSVVTAGTRDTQDAMCGIFVMYDAVAGKILSAGGSQSYTDSKAYSTAHITTIGAPYQPSTNQRVADMNFKRGFANAVVLPDGTVFVTGGQPVSLVFTNTNGVLVPELYNPKTNTWTQMAQQSVPRNYHSVSILLPDGTVFSGGGGLCYVPFGGSLAKCDKSVDHQDGEIFSPPYLFNSDGNNAVRPVISNLAQQSYRAGGALKFTVSGGAQTFSLVRMGTATHSVNTDQRRIPLNNISIKGQQVTAQLPSDNGILLPGYYYLFAMTAQNTPSVAQTVHITL